MWQLSSTSQPEPGSHLITRDSLDELWLFTEKMNVFRVSETDLFSFPLTVSV